jgi:transposase-like protein
MTVAIERDPIYRGRRFQSEIIELCVRWYLTYRLSYRDLVEMLAERGVVVSHTTIYRWVQQYVPEFDRRWSRYAKAVHPSWRVDETAISVRGGHRYLYRAVDKFGKTVDSLLCADRSVWAARAFFCKAVKTHHPRPPQKVNLDGNAASHRALRLLRKENPNLHGVVIRSSRYLNNIVEQDHRAIKRRCAPMLSLKSFRTAAITLAGVELAHRIRKGQFSLRPGAAPELSSFKHLWARALKRRVVRAPTRPDEPRPPMQQNSKIRIQSDQDVRNIEPVRHARKITVGRCLYLNVTPMGGRSWYYKFYYEGKCEKLMVGTYPEITLESAKSRHQYARKLLAHGINPCAIKRTLGRNAFRLHMREWETMETVTDPTARHPDLGAPAFTVDRCAAGAGRSFVGRRVGRGRRSRFSPANVKCAHGKTIIGRARNQICRGSRTRM